MDSNAIYTCVSAQFPMPLLQESIVALGTGSFPILMEMSNPILPPNWAYDPNQPIQLLFQSSAERNRLDQQTSVPTPLRSPSKICFFYFSLNL